VSFLNIYKLCIQTIRLTGKHNTHKTTILFCVVSMQQISRIRGKLILWTTTYKNK